MDIFEIIAGLPYILSSIQEYLEYRQYGRIIKFRISFDRPYGEMTYVDVLTVKVVNKGITIKIINTGAITNDGRELNAMCMNFPEQNPIQLEYGYSYKFYYPLESLRNSILISNSKIRYIFFEIDGGRRFRVRVRKPKGSKISIPDIFDNTDFIFDLTVLLKTLATLRGK